MNIVNKNVSIFSFSSFGIITDKTFTFNIQYVAIFHTNKLIRKGGGVIFLRNQTKKTIAARLIQTHDEHSKQKCINIFIFRQKQGHT